MPRARFVNDTATIEVNAKTEKASVGVMSNTITGRVGTASYPQTLSHRKLTDRDLADQHPIDAITDLRELLDRADTFVYEQSIASDTWEIEHNLDKFPSVTIVDSAGTAYYAAVQYESKNKIIVTMNGATTGKAYLN